VISLPEPTGTGAVLVEQAPIAWQEVNGNRLMVTVQYAVDKNEKVSFVFPDGYDSALPLVIDPTLTYSTYLAGSKTDQADAVTLDADCNLYITGSTYSSNFPTVNPFQTNLPAGDVFVTKLDTTTSTVLYSTYLGGSADDHGWGIRLDSQGRIGVVGETESSDFPTQNAYDPTCAGGTCDGDPCDDAFVAQLSSDGSSLRYSTYLGNTADEEANDMAIGPDDQIYLTGNTNSSSFPVVNGYQTSFGGGTCGSLPATDGIVTKINPAVSGVGSLLYSTYLGGNNCDAGTAIAVDTSGRVYVAGYTSSSNFPVLGAYQSTRASSSDIFVSKFDTTLSGTASLLYSTYLGGNDSDHANGLALNGTNQVYLTGYTQSTNFPRSNPFDNTFGGGTTCASNPCYDAFVTHLDIANNLLVYSSYLGGSSEEQGASITVDDNGNAYVTGYIKSTDFTTLAAIQSVKGTDSCSTPPCADAFVTKVDSTGALVYSTYLGGSAQDYGNAIVVNGLGGTYIVGYTYSSNFPTSPNTFPFVGGSGYPDAFVVKIDD